MSIHTIDLENVRYGTLVELMENTKGQFKDFIFLIGPTEYYLTGLEFTHDAEGGRYKFTFHTDQDPVFSNVYIDKEDDRQRHLKAKYKKLGTEFKRMDQRFNKPTRELHLTALDKLLLENDISYGK